MTKPGFGKLAFLLILLISTLHVNQTLADQGGSIGGTVLDATDEPLPGATVNLIDFTGTNKGSSTTDASGNYSFAGLPTGLYKVQFSKTGMLTAWNGGATSQQTAVLIELLAPNTITGISGKLVPGASISGTVTDADNNQMTGVTLNLFNSAGSFIDLGTTDSSGNYLINGLVGGTYYLRFSASGMPSVWYGGASTRQTSTPLTLSAPNAATGINCQLGVGGSIRGTVTDLMNVPLPNASVTLYDAAKNVIDWEWGFTNVDASGNYAFKGLASGTYYITFSEAGKLSNWYGGASLETAMPITVVSPNATTGINGQLGPGGSIRGTITDASNNPLSGVSLNLYNWTKGNVAFAYTDSLGNYSFDGLASGSYYLNCSKSGIPSIWYGGATALEMATPIDVTVPNETAGINVQMVTISGGGSITGRVTDANDMPLNGVSVNLFDSAGNAATGTGVTTDSTGNYNLTELASGTYYIQFSPSSTGMPPIWYNGSSTRQQATPITVHSPDATTGINGKLGVGGSISGTVTNPTSIPLQGVGVSLYDSAGNYYLGMATNYAGGYSFKGLADGMYYIQFSISGMPLVWYGAPLVITAQNSLTGINGILLAGGTIRGTVRDAYNTPISNARVSLYNNVGDSVVTLTTDTSGNYMIGGIAGGTYYLKFSANGMQPIWYGGTANQLNAMPVTVISSSVLTGIDGQLGIGGSISGRILGASDFLTVSLFDATGKLLSYTRPYELGYYSFTGLSSGIYYVQVTFFYRYGAIWYGGATWQTATPIEVTAPGAVTGIDITYGGFSDNWIDSEVYGTGGGTITSAPVGISCMKDLTAGCSAPFAKSETVTLYATPDATSVFSRWGGDCTELSTCIVNMASTHYIYAVFTAAPKAKIGDTGYLSLGFAYTAAATGEEIHALDTVLAENLVLAENKFITVKGGYKADYGSRSGNNTVLSGSLTVQNGRLTLDSLTIK